MRCSLWLQLWFQRGGGGDGTLTDFVIIGNNQEIKTTCSPPAFVLKDLPAESWAEIWVKSDCRRSSSSTCPESRFPRGLDINGFPTTTTTTKTRPRLCVDYFSWLHGSPSLYVASVHPRTCGHSCLFFSHFAFR